MKLTRPAVIFLESGGSLIVLIKFLEPPFDYGAQEGLVFRKGGVAVPGPPIVTHSQKMATCQGPYWPGEA